MATQQEVFDFITSNYRHELVGDFVVKIRIPLEVQKPDRTQVVYAAVTEDALQVTSPFAWQDRVEAEQVFNLNKSMFGVVTVNGAYALKHNAYIVDLDESEIQHAFVYLGFFADELEEKLGFDDEF